MVGEGGRTLIHSHRETRTQADIITTDESPTLRNRIALPIGKLLLLHPVLCFLILFLRHPLPPLSLAVVVAHILALLVFQAALFVFWPEQLSLGWSNNNNKNNNNNNTRSHLAGKLHCNTLLLPLSVSAYVCVLCVFQFFTSAVYVCVCLFFVLMPGIGCFVCVDVAPSPELFGEWSQSFFSFFRSLALYLVQLSRSFPLAQCQC